MIATPLDAARALLLRGYAVLPIPFRQKAPILRDWPELRLTETDLPEHFNGKPMNLGIILGEPSGGLVDVDLDCPEALALADQFLPATPVTTGRASTPRSHRWYVATGAKTVKHRDPVCKDSLVELRSTGSQTLVGPSVHPETGEPYDMLTGEPAVVTPEHLTACVDALAAAIVRRRHPERIAAAAPAPPVSPRPPTTAARIDQETVIRRATAYLDKIPPSIAGADGHDQTFIAAVAMVYGFDLGVDAGFALLWDRYNPRCQPPWTEKELRHKVGDAATKPHDKPRGWLRDAPSTSGGEAIPESTADGSAEHTAASTRSRVSQFVVQSALAHVAMFPELREPVIDGYLRKGETMTIVAPAKAGKTHLVHLLLGAIASGRPWLGIPTKLGRVLIVDKELHNETLSGRMRWMRSAMALDDESMDRITLWPMRGTTLTIAGVAATMRKEVEPGTYSVIFLDALYRFQAAGFDENSNAQQTETYNLLDQLAEEQQAAIIVVHHAPKGNQSEKNVTDVGAGGGAMSRAADSHVVLREHEQEKHFVVEARVRSWKQPEPFVVRWADPGWTLAPELDPTLLRKPKGRGQRLPANGTDAEPIRTWTLPEWAADFVGDQHRIKAEIIDAAHAEGMSKADAKSRLQRAERDGLVFRQKRRPTEAPTFSTKPPETLPRSLG